MTTELLMRADIIFEQEKLIIGGSESKYSTTDLSRVDFLNKEIMIQTARGNCFYKVLKIDMYYSIAGAIRLGLKLEDSVQFCAICEGDKVFKILERREEK